MHEIMIFLSFKIVLSIFGTLAAPIFGVFLLGFFFPRVKSQVIV